MQNAPSLRALKLMHLMIATAGGRMAEDVRHEIRLSDIRRIEGMNHHDKDSLRTPLEELKAAVLTYDEPEKMRYTIGGLVDHAVVDYRQEAKGDVLVWWYFGRMFREMAEKSNHWTILDRQTVFHLGSKYSVLLFQHVASLTGLEHVQSKTFTVAELRGVLGVPEGKLVRFADLNRRALQSAIEEINQLSRLMLTATPKKIGRTVTSVTIAWKTNTDPAEMKRELNRPKIGRKMRRDNSTETIAPAFPAAGGITYAQSWQKIKRDAGCNKDDQLIASDFRRFCASKQIALDARNIETVFASYCRKVGKV
ncbi:replication initiation protein [Loktanella sp. DJP18]|uniref:replication initiation protein n=1 Tax=Loktanella sp. DJP18 TaxID=3409788 RepID=UPI003BB7C79F